MKHELMKLMQTEGAAVTVMLKTLDTSETLFEHNARQTLSSASTIKIPILIEVLRLVSEKKLSLEDKIELSQNNRVDFSRVTEFDRDKFSIHELLYWMITVSDNSATNQLIDVVTMDAVNALLCGNGFSATVLKRKMMDLSAREQGIDNLTSAYELASMLEMLYNGEFLPGYFSSLALHYLKSQRDKGGLMRYITDDVTVASKTGSLDGLTNDAGIFWLQNRRVYVLSVCVSELTNDENGWRLIGRISQLVYNNLLGGSK